MRLTALLCISGLSVLGHALANSYTTKLEWDASTSPDVAGYRVSYGSASGSYTSHIDVPNTTSVTASGLASGGIYFFAVKAYNSSGLESGFSNEVRFQPGRLTSQVSILAPRDIVLKMTGIIGHSYVIEATQDLRTWTSVKTVTVGDGGTLEFHDPDAGNYPRRFYRIRDLNP